VASTCGSWILAGWVGTSSACHRWSPTSQVPEKIRVTADTGINGVLDGVWVISELPRFFKHQSQIFRENIAGTPLPLVGKATVFP